MKRITLTVVLLKFFYVIPAQNCDTNLFPDRRQYYDTYHEVVSEPSDWKHFNTHDPSVNKQGEWYYMYSTDASWANLHETGALKRRSRDLVNWEFLGTAFDGVPQSAQDFFINGYNPEYTDVGIWAPFLLNFKNRYILYYSAPGGLDGVNLAFLGYATSDSAGGPWVDQGMITTSIPGDTINAIDPTVVYDSTTHRLWMAYGSWHTGIYMLELDTATGGIKTPGDRGVRVAARATGYGLEAPEICYRDGWYYLFVSYDPLLDVYNVRVGRSRNANGPYYDINGVDMADPSSNFPMILAPYRFDDHPGWQGTGHCGVFNDNGTYYMFNQGRPSIEPAMMVLHVREIFWIDGWPVVSPERFAGVPECTIYQDSLVGEWEHLPLIYKTSPGNFHSRSGSLELNADGTFNNDPENTWTLEGDTLILNWTTGDIQILVVHWGWDWENSCRTLLYTGINTSGLCIWGKKINQDESDRYTELIHGATYSIRNLHSHMLMHVPGSSDIPGISIKQGSDNGLGSQLWKINESGNGYYYLFPHHSQIGLVMEVQNGTADNYNDLIVNPVDGTDKQQFLIHYLQNGYFRILTKVSDNESCADVEGYSLEEGGNIFQWTYLGGLNQMWRFEKIDSIAIDPVYLSEPWADEDEFIRVYPNPSSDGNIFLDLTSLNECNTLEVSVAGLRGDFVQRIPVGRLLAYRIDLDLPVGIYIIRVVTEKRQYVNRLIIR